MPIMGRASSGVPPSQPLLMYQKADDQRSHQSQTWMLLLHHQLEMLAQPTWCMQCWALGLIVQSVSSSLATLPFFHQLAALAFEALLESLNL